MNMVVFYIENDRPQLAIKELKAYNKSDAKQFLNQGHESSGRLS